jgi:hypothetical protein
MNVEKPPALYWVGDGFEHWELEHVNVFGPERFPRLFSRA